MRKNNTRKKPNYKGPFQNNPNLQVQNVRKSMRTDTDGPTVDTFSTMDTTTNMVMSDSNISKEEKKKVKRPTVENQRKFQVSTEWVFGIVFAIVSAVVGTVIYNHSNKFVAIEKDIDYMKDDIKEEKKQIEKISDQTNSIDKKNDLLNQKVDFKSQKK